MSASVMCDVLAAPTPRGEHRLVLLMIADSAGEHGSAIINWASLGRHCAMDGDELRAAVNALVEDEFLAVAHVGDTVFHIVIPGGDEEQKARALELGMQEIERTSGKPELIRFGSVEEIVI